MGGIFFLYNDAFTMISGYEDPSENEINDLKSALGRYHNSQFKNITFASRNYLTLSNQIDLLNITATVMTPEDQLRSQVYNVLSSYIPVTLFNYRNLYYMVFFHQPADRSSYQCDD